jgi:hypothetical protein
VGEETGVNVGVCAAVDVNGTGVSEAVEDGAGVNRTLDSVCGARQPESNTASAPKKLHARRINLDMR